MSIIATLVSAGVGSLFVGYNSYLSQLPDPATLASMEPPLDTHVFARDGTEIHIFHSQGSRHEHIDPRTASPWATKATIAVEDRHFRDHASWDLPRIVKAGWGQVRHDPGAGGASTITEQLAKISFLQDNGSLDYKIKELILGTQIEANFSKDQILDMYLNRIPYGNHAIGLESAAELYFHIGAHDLDLAQAALLAGLPNSPTVLNPVLHSANETLNPAAKERQRVVLAAMEATRDITAQQGAAALAEPLTVHGWWEDEPNIAPDFLQYLQKYLVAKYGDVFIQPGGWDIYTSIDLTKQAMMEQSLGGGISAIKDRFNARDGAMVSMDPKTGEIVAMAGSWNHGDPGVGQLNMAIRRIQPGSTIKLFTYTAAIASRQFTPTTSILDAPIKLDDGSREGYQPHNYDLKFHGNCPLQLCLGNSFNIPAVKTESALGIPFVTNLEIAAGLTSLQDPNNRPCPKCYAATLGALTYGITPLELANGASTIANLGVHQDPAPVLKIVNRVDRAVLFAHDPATAGRRVVPENAAFIMNEITSNDNNRLLEFGPKSDLTLKDRRVSAKTGTTDFFASNWTVGWTPELVTAVWVGNPTPSCLKDEDRAGLAGRLRGGDKIDEPLTPSDLARYGLQPRNDHCGHLEGSTGITGAAPIWHDYMTKALATTPATWFPKPSDVIATGPGDDATFYLPATYAAPPPSAPCTSNCGGYKPGPKRPPVPTAGPGAHPGDIVGIDNRGGAVAPAGSPAGPAPLPPISP